MRLKIYNKLLLIGAKCMYISYYSQLHIKFMIFIQSEDKNMLFIVWNWKKTIQFVELNEVYIVNIEWAIELIL